MKTYSIIYLLGFSLLPIRFSSCADRVPDPSLDSLWVRDAQNPILRDEFQSGGYESASDGHIFYDETGQLYMIYSGDTDGYSSIKLAKGNSISEWERDQSLLFEPNSLELDIEKETAFYHKSQNGKHQIYYIGYTDSTYQSQIFLAEADEIEGPYRQIAEPIIARGNLAEQEVYCITSPSVIEHDSLLYIMFLGWNASPQEVTEVWTIGATSSDDGYTWSDFQLVETPIGMEGQVTKAADGSFVAVRTSDYANSEALFYATSPHPFGPWEANETPILLKDFSDLEKDEIIAPQITFDPITGEEYLFYTGADHQKGWWMMLAREE